MVGDVSDVVLLFVVLLTGATPSLRRPSSSSRAGSACCVRSWPQSRSISTFRHLGITYGSRRAVS